MKNPTILSKLLRYLTLISPVLLVTACSSVPGTLSGNDLSHLSLRDKRMSDKTVDVLVNAPKDVSVLGQVVSERCQDTLFSEAPLEKTLMVDMKAEAYRLGANAISDVKIEHKGAMGEGCWNMYTATANMLVVE